VDIAPPPPYPTRWEEVGEEMIVIGSHPSLSEVENKGMEKNAERLQRDLQSTSEPSEDTLKLGGRLLDFVKRWESTCGGSWLLKRGFEIDWESQQKKNFVELYGPKKRECPQSKERKLAMRSVVKEMLEKEIIIEISPAEVKLASPSYVIPKAKGGYRQIMDLRFLNRFTKDISFQMEDTTMLMQMVREGDYATSIDLKSAFNHIPTSPSALYFLTFFFEGKVYAWKGMPFGAKHSPLVFTKIMKVVLKYIRERWKVRCIGYMDDLLFLHESRSELERITKEIAEYLRWLGWVLSEEKCETTPKQMITFLGWQWNFQRMEVCMKAERKRSLQKLVKTWLMKCRGFQNVQNRDLAALLGKLNFLRVQFPRMSLYTTALNRAKVRGVKLSGWNGRTRVSFQQTGELKLILRWVTNNSPRSIRLRTPTATLTTDACKEGWGATLEVKKEKSLYHGDFGGWKTPLTSSNQRETAAVLLAIRSCKEKLKEQKVNCLCVESDNSTTVSNLAKKRGAKSMLELVRKIFSLTESLDMEVIAKYRPGVENKTADALSRLEGAGDYFLKQEIFWKGLEGLKEEKEAVSDMVEIDLFATSTNTRLNKFISPNPQIEAEGSDAFSVSWKGRKVYAHPPISLIPKVLLRIELERVNAVVVTPKWASQAWWPRLMQLAQRMVTLGETTEILTMGEMMKKRKTKLPPGELIMSRICWEN
jgi:ribonuclease HI